MKRALVIALACSCHAYDQAYLDCMSSGHCVDGAFDAGVPDAGAGPVDAGTLFLDDPSNIDLGLAAIGQRTDPVIRNLVNAGATPVTYALAYDARLGIDFSAVDGGPACDTNGIPADSVCRWEITLVPDVAGQFNGGITLDSDAGHLQLSVTALVH